MSKLEELAELGQSIWYDNISRAMLDSGEMEALIASGIRGVTSNPSIFENAIAKTSDYDVDILSAPEESTNEEVYESLVIADISRVADMLRPVYDGTRGVDGYISLEVSPKLAYDTAATVEAARRFWQIIDKPNLMIKVPATAQGVDALRQLTAEGINVNVTLLFSVTAYELVAEAYLEGLEARVEAGFDVSDVHSVASFFISRLDALVDEQLDEMKKPGFKGKSGIENAKLAYASFQRIFSGSRWVRLERGGANLQRPLWASTGTKSPSYPETMYVDGLIGKNTVNTTPPKTLAAFLESGTAEISLVDLDKAEPKMGFIKAAGIDYNANTDYLLAQGVQKFSDAFDALLESVDQKRDALSSGS